MNWHQKILAFMSEIKAQGLDPLTYSEVDGVGTLVIYGMIDEYWGVSADAVVRTLTDKAPDKLIVRLNSPGGSVFEGYAIYNFLKAQAYPVDVIIDGYAASIASVIMLAGKKISASPLAMVMIHEAWTFTYGNAEELRKTANLLEKISSQIRDLYVARTGKTADEISTMMKADTWFTADEALEAGFIDELIESDAAESNKASNILRKVKALFGEPSRPAPSWNSQQAKMQIKTRVMLAETL